MYRKLQTLPPFLKKNFYFYLFIYGCVGSSFLCEDFLSSCGKWGPLFIAVRGPLTIAASLVAEHRLQTRRLSNCGSRAQLLCGMWDLPRPGIEPVSPALAGRFSTTAPPEKPSPLALTLFGQWEAMARQQRTGGERRGSKTFLMLPCSPPGSVSLAMAAFWGHRSCWVASLLGLQRPLVFLTEFPPLVSSPGGVLKGLHPVVSR